MDLGLDSLNSFQGLKATRVASSYMGAGSGAIQDRANTGLGCHDTGGGQVLALDWWASTPKAN